MKGPSQLEQGFKIETVGFVVAWSTCYRRLPKIAGRRCSNSLVLPRDSPRSWLPREHSRWDHTV